MHEFFDNSKAQMLREIKRPIPMRLRRYQIVVFDTNQKLWYNAPYDDALLKKCDAKFGNDRWGLLRVIKYYKVHGEN